MLTDSSVFAKLGDTHGEHSVITSIEEWWGVLIGLGVPGDYYLMRQWYSYCVVNSAIGTRLEMARCGG